jgi:NAD-dependent deacetylase
MRLNHTKINYIWMKKTLVVLSGAGISAESGVATFRDMNGLWEQHRIEDVATPEGWQRNPALVLDFYNKRRSQLKTVEPNRGHIILAELQAYFNVKIITQNVDNLHERAGSEQVWHLHGELTKVRSTKNPNLIYDWTKDCNIGDTCELGSQLRPHIVWFGEAVPAIEYAVELVAEADIFVVVGTSLQVYPAASLIDFVGDNVPKYVIDPHIPTISDYRNLTCIEEKASIGLAQLKSLLLQL